MPMIAYDFASRLRLDDCPYGNVRGVASKMRAVEKYAGDTHDDLAIELCVRHEDIRRNANRPNDECDALQRRFRDFLVHPGECHPDHRKAKRVDTADQIVDRLWRYAGRRGNLIQRHVLNPMFAPQLGRCGDDLRISTRFAPGT